MTAPADAPPSPPPLQYAPRPGPLRRRLARRVGVLLIVFAATFVSIRWGRPVAGRVELLYWQRQCLHYTAPPDQVVYEHGANGPPALLAGGGDYVPVTVRPDGFQSSTPLTAAAHLPRCAEKFLAQCPGPCISLPAGVLFMHERQTPSGARRLVIVTSGFLQGATPLFIPGHDVKADILRPGTLRQPPEEKVGPVILDVLFSQRPTPIHLRVFAGQADAVDPTHFTIAYEFDGQRHVVDGHLEDAAGCGPAFSGLARVRFQVDPPPRK